MTHTKRLILAAIIGLGFGTVQAQDAPRAAGASPVRQQLQDRDIFGSQIMTPQERAEYRQRLQAARTEEERERIRSEHHEQITARARERGVTLPEQPPATRPRAGTPGAGAEAARGAYGGGPVGGGPAGRR